MKILAGQFEFSEDQMVVQWQNLNYLMLSWNPTQNVLKGNNSKLSPPKCFLRKVVKEQALLKESYSFLVDTVKSCLTQPDPKAVVERGASAINREKTRLRNCQKNDMLSACLQLSINGPELNSDECKAILTEATQTWLNTHNRNVPPLNLPKIGGSNHADARDKQSVTIGIQTEATGMYC